MRVSIRTRQTVLTLASISVVWCTAWLLSYRQAEREVAAWDDARLVQLAQMLVLLDQRDLLALSNRRIDVRNEYVPDMRDSVTEDSDLLPREALFQVQDTQRVLAGSPELVALGAWDSAPDLESGSRTITLRGQSWHAYTLRDDASGRTVRVLEPANARSDLGTGVARRIARPMAISLPFIALLVWISISVSLAPLKSLSNVIRARDINKLEPIDMRRTPFEVQPLVEAINQLLSRLRQSIMRERAFVADAAHELKTPLAAIKVQAQVALGADDLTQQRLAISRVVQGVDRSAHLADQLLLLARLDESSAMPTSRVDLAAVAKAAMVAREEHARDRGMSLTLNGGACSEVSADATLLSILLDNLLDNAIKYGHEGGHIEIAVCQGPHTVTLTVSDDGPGVTAEDRLRLTNRFFRVIGNRASGSGLGLSIVARIVEYCGARLGFDTGIGGRGLSVAVAFPRREATP